MKIISFSLWGQDPKYTIGAIRNAELAQKIYPGWVCRFYVGASVPYGVIHELEKFEHVQVVQKSEWGNWKSMFWRFEPAGEEEVEIMISRDTDSRLNHREKSAVDEWINSDLGFHIMRDHPYHQYPVLGGMWGAKKGTLPDMKGMIESFSQQDRYGTDYEFFASMVSHIKDNVMVHDEFFDKKNFPQARDGLQFVGEVFDEHENNVTEHSKALESHLFNVLHIHHHLGLGDHIDCNGMVRNLLKDKKADRIYVFVKRRYYNLIEYMYRDDSNIILIPVSNDLEHQDVQQYSEKNKASILRIGHENYPWGREKELGKGCAEIFYDQINMPYSVRFDDFYYERNEEDENKLLNKLNPSNLPYVFVHDDPNRGFEISDEMVLKLSNKKNIKIIRNDITENVFHYGKLLENAQQIHCMESCFRSLIETLDTTQELYFHNFRAGASGYLGSSTLKEWKEVKR